MWVFSSTARAWREALFARSHLGKFFRPRVPRHRTRSVAVLFPLFAASGAPFFGFLHDRTGSYNLSFTIFSCALFTVVGSDFAGETTGKTSHGVRMSSNRTLVHRNEKLFRCQSSLGQSLLMAVERKALDVLAVRFETIFPRIDGTQRILPLQLAPPP